MDEVLMSKVKGNLAEVTGTEVDAPAKKKEGESEADTIFKAVYSLRAKAKKLSPQGREKLFAAIKEFIG